MSLYNTTPYVRGKPQSPGHILVVGGEWRFCNFLRLSLQHEGYIVSTACGSQEAIDQFQKMGIDLVLVDSQSPDAEGHALCSELRKSTTVPIIFMATVNCPTDMLLGYRAGADAYVAKPFPLREVATHIQRLLDRTHRQYHA